MVALSSVRTVVLGLSFAIMVTGCKKNPATDDASLNTQVQQSLSADPTLSGQPIQASVADGVVTLTGTVSNDAVRTVASGDAARIAGVRTVVNNLVVQPPQPGVTTAIAQPAAVRPEKTKKPSAATPQYTPPQPAPERERDLLDPARDGARAVTAAFQRQTPARSARSSSRAASRGPGTARPRRSPGGRARARACPSRRA